MNSKVNGFPTGAVFLGFVGVFRRNAYIRRNTLSGLRFCLVMYFYVHSLRKIRALRVLLVSPRFDVTGFARNERNAYIQRNTLSGLRFAFLPASSYSKGGVAPPTLPSIMTKEVSRNPTSMPPLMVRGRVTPTPMPPLFAKGEESRSDGGDKK